MWAGEYEKAQVGISHERLTEEFHSALYSFQQVYLPLDTNFLCTLINTLLQMGTIDLLDAVRVFIDVQPTCNSLCSLCGVRRNTERKKS